VNCLIIEEVQHEELTCIYLLKVGLAERCTGLAYCYNRTSQKISSIPSRAKPI